MTGSRAESRLPVATVGLGSNLGDRETTIAGAIRWIAEHPGNRLLVESSLYETEPFGKTDQPGFLNSVIRVETSLTLEVFFLSLRRAEALWGRRRGEPWGPRTLDLDLLLFGEIVFSDETLTVPHPGIALRRFVLEPLCEIAPELVHPTLGRTVRALRHELEDRCQVTRLGRLAFGRRPTGSPTV